MLYVLHGDDFKRRAGKLEEMVSFFLGKNPNTSFVKVRAENFAAYDLDELALGQGLFAQKCVVVLDGLFENKEIKEAVAGKLPSLASSGNIFIVNERLLSKTDLSALEKRADKAQVFSAKEKTIRPAFNIFSLADAVGGRDKRRAWTLYLRAIENGSEPEEIHGTIFWQIKNMLLVKETARPTALTTGLKPFVLTKAKAFSDNYSKDELKHLSSRLVSLYHDSHRGIGDFSIGLEKLLLESL